MVNAGAASPTLPTAAAEAGVTSPPRAVTKVRPATVVPARNVRRVTLSGDMWLSFTRASAGGAQPRDGLQRALPPQARLGRRGPSPATACGAHYHHRRASAGGAPAPRRPAARTTTRSYLVERVDDGTFGQDLR